MNRWLRMLVAAIGGGAALLVAPGGASAASGLSTPGAAPAAMQTQVTRTPFGTLTIGVSHHRASAASSGTGGGFNY